MHAKKHVSRGNRGEISKSARLEFGYSNRVEVLPIPDGAPAWTVGWRYLAVARNRRIEKAYLASQLVA